MKKEVAMRLQPREVSEILTGSHVEVLPDAGFRSVFYTACDV